MADSIREQILQALQTKLEGITPGNGFDLDTTGRISRCVRSHDPDNLPAVVLWDGPEVPEHKAGFTKQLMEFTVEVLVSVADSDSASAPLNQWMAEIIKGITQGDTSLTGLVEATQYTGAETQYSTVQSDAASVLINFQVIYNTVRGDPYTQP
jgi:hypothetical protein